MTSTAYSTACDARGLSRVKLLRLVMLTAGLTLGGLLATWTVGNWDVKACANPAPIAELRAEFKNSLPHRNS